LFSEAHVFQHGEVRTYQLIARQIEAAILQAAPLEQKTRPVAQQPVSSHAVAEVADQQRGFLNKPGSIDDPLPTNSISPRHSVPLMAAREFLRNRSAMLANTIRVATNVLWRGRQWRLALAVVAVAISVTCWIAYHDRRPVSPLEPSSRPTSTVIDPQARAKSLEALPEKATTLVERSVKPTTQKVGRVKVGWNEVDYGEDVTVRYFTPSPTSQRKPTSNGRVVYIGEDVTVRYFTPTPAQRPGRQ
jgi:hypothetical protein